jgi:broad specificity phosphatase PhoE
MMTLPFHTNRYFILRHGHSQANEEGLIVSSPQNAIGHWGLTEQGKKEVTRTMEKAVQDGLFNPQITPVVVASPFLRTLETAAIAAKIIKAPSYPDSNLRERFFGEFEMTSNANYEKGWAFDEKNPEHTEFGVESILSVAKRMVEMVKRTGLRYNEKDIIFVTHGDPGQILQCVFDGIDPVKHRSLPPLETGELRPLSIR